MVDNDKNGRVEKGEYKEEEEEEEDTSSNYISFDIKDNNDSEEENEEEEEEDDESEEEEDDEDDEFIFFRNDDDEEDDDFIVFGDEEVVSKERKRKRVTFNDENLYDIFEYPSQDLIDQYEKNEFLKNDLDHIVHLADKVRFRHRITNCEQLLTKVLSKKHRENIYQKRFVVQDV